MQNTFSVRSDSMAIVTAIENAPPIMSAVSIPVSCGNAKLGKPSGISPRTTTPCPSRSNATETAKPIASTMSAPGSFGANRAMTNSAANIAIESARERMFTFAANAAKSMRSKAVVPKSFGS